MQMDLQSQETIATVKAENECMEINEEGDGETQALLQSETQPTQTVFNSNKNLKSGDGETQVPLQSETQSTQTVFDSNQNLKSGVWKEFVSVGVGNDGKERGRCIHCSKHLVIDRIHGTSHLRRHVISCQKEPKRKSGGNDGQNRRIYDHKNNSIDVVRASVSESSCDRGVSSILSKKRQHSSISEVKTRSAMLLGVDILDCPVCFEALTIPIFQVLFLICFSLNCSFSYLREFLFLVTKLSSL